ncbi:MAG TPA: V-type ATP synthase subunit D [Mycobacteriales bacterium]
MTIRGLPPGRAGRLWLDRRIGVARRAADVLDRRLRILAAHQARLEVDASRAEVAWRSRHAEAETWLLRAAVLAHRRGIRTAAADRPEAGIELGREVVAGVTFPVLVRFTVGEPTPSAAPAATAAADPAARACAAALEAAVRYALTDAAARAVRVEAEQTRVRRRAVADRWLPRLQDRLHTLNAELDEQERAEATSRRRGLGR